MSSLLWFLMLVIAVVLDLLADVQRIVARWGLRTGDLLADLGSAWLTRSQLYSNDPESAIGSARTSMEHWVTRWSVVEVFKDAAHSDRVSRLETLRAEKLRIDRW